MNKIDKFLNKLVKDDRVLILKILNQVKSSNLDNFDVKKLKGYSNTYRVRVGRMRIVFTRGSDGITIDKLDFRNDNTY